jgi:Reeler domain
MKKPALVISRVSAALVLLAAVFGPLNLIGSARPHDAPPGLTNAPGEANCASCHNSYPLNSGPASFAITAPLTYVPITNQTVTVAFTNTPFIKHGFQITARDGNNNPVGGWEVVMSGMTKNTAGSSFYHEQTNAGTTLSSWTMDWTSPPALVPGPVTFYACGVDANSNLLPFLDYVYTATHKLYQATLSTPSPGWAIGASHALALAAPNHAGDLYFIVPSLNPAPFALGGPFKLEVTPDDLFPLVTDLPEVFQNLFGTLDAAAQGNATVNVPDVPALIGIQLHFAAATATPALNPTEVSNRITVTFQ